MKVGILQPGYIPWLGFFEQIARTDLFVIYDDVQYDKNGWRNRNRIKTAEGIQWLTVPVLLKNRKHPLIKDVLIDNKTDWRKKHLETIRHAYHDARFYKDYFGDFSALINQSQDKLLDLNLSLIHWLMKCLELERTLILSSSLSIQGQRTERLVNICKQLGADEFYEGQAGKNYLDEAQFQNAGIRLTYQNYLHPAYPQLHGDFLSHLSALDLVFNCGPEAGEILLLKSSRTVSA